MAVTKKLLALLPLSALLISCSVELSENTYGAGKACDPNLLELTEFETILTDFLQNTGTLPNMQPACGSCHSTDTGLPSAARFGIRPETDDTTKTQNFCSAFAESDRIGSDFLTTTHPGGAFDPTVVADIIAWAQSLEE